MATTLLVTASPVRGSSVHRGAPRKLFHGVSRTLVRKTLAKINAILNSDARERVRASNLGFTPHYIASVSGGVVNNAFLRVAQRLQQVLDLKEGDE